MLVGYARTSTFEQMAGLEDQCASLLATGSTKIFSEMVSSVSVRPQLDAALDFVREGDVLIVQKIDRLARSTADLLRIIAILEEKGVALRILSFGGSEIDTRSPTGKMLITMFGAVAEFERALMLERQRVGIAKAKAEGKYRGRKPTARAKRSQVVELYGSGLRPAQIAERAGISRASVYRLLAEAL
ncbi:MAG: recombinase family protein [Sphingobium sp.]